MTAKKQPKRKQRKPTAAGSNSTYSEAVATIICARIAEGEFLRVICRELEIPWRTVHQWREDRPDFAERYQKARDLGLDAILEDTLEIADTPFTGEETEEDANGNIVKIKRADALGHRKLRIETRLKALAKFNPKKYGDLLKVGDPDGKPMSSVAPVLNVTLKKG